MTDLEPSSAGRRISDPLAPIDLAREADFALGPARIRPPLSEVTVDGASIRLQPRVMQVLVALVRAQGEVVSRDDLVASCWGGIAIGEDAINRCIGQLRRLSEDDAPGAFAIETLPRIGYRLKRSQPDDEARAGGGLEGAAPAAGHKLSICVLPFANMSDDPQQEYFSDGISEDIITDLSKVSALSVVARNTAFTFKGKAVEAPQVAQALNVGYLLQGSVRKAGQRVRISAQLIDGAAGDHLWAERWDRDLDDIFALQDEISEAIVGALKLKLLPEEKQAIELRGTRSADAYDLYLLAHSYLLTGNVGDMRRWEAIERLCRQAVSLDPDYAHAWALLALALYNLRHTFGRVGDSSQAALDRALALHSDLAGARSLKARMLSDEGRHDDAAAESAAALALDPDSYEVVFRAGYVNCARGRLEDAARYYDRAASFIETEIRAIPLLVGCYAALGDAKNTRRAATIALGRAEKVLAQDRGNGFAMGVAVGALAALGETDRAKDWMARALLVDPDNLVMRYRLACASAAWLGDPEAALGMLGPVLERVPGCQLLWEAMSEPSLAHLREDPRFKTMIAQAQARLAVRNSA